MFTADYGFSAVWIDDANKCF